MSLAMTLPPCDFAEIRAHVREHVERPCGLGIQQTMPGMEAIVAITWSRLAWNSAHFAVGTSCGPSAHDRRGGDDLGMLVMWLELSVVTAAATASGRP